MMFRPLVYQNIYTIDSSIHYLLSDSHIDQEEMIGIELYIIECLLPMPLYFLSSRVLTHAYVYCLNAWLLVFPVHLSYDWQMGSVPLVTSLMDKRNLLSFSFLFSLIALTAMSWYKVKVGHKPVLLLQMMGLLVAVHSYIILDFISFGN